MKKYIFIFVTGILLSTQAQAVALFSRSINQAVDPSAIKSVKIVYAGNITSNKITALGFIIDEINQKYKSTQNIYLYINSFGGKIDNAKMGYDIINSSPIPVTTINLSRVQSSTVLLYCGAKNRLVMENSIFLLNSPDMDIGANAEFFSKNGIPLTESDITPDNERVNLDRNIIKNIYKSCTTLSDEQIDRINYNQENHKYFNKQQAMDIKLANGEAKSIISTEVSYYIYDEK